MSKDDLNLLALNALKTNRILIINKKRVLNIALNNINKISNNVYKCSEDLYIDHISYIAILNAVKSKYVPNNNFDDTVQVTSFYTLYNKGIENHVIYSLCYGHLGYKIYEPTPLAQGGFSTVVLYKNLNMVAKEYNYMDDIGSDYSFCDSEDSSEKKKTTSSDIYKKELKLYKTHNPEIEHQEELYEELPYDMIREITIFNYFRNIRSINKHLPKVLYIDLEKRIIYFQKYTEIGIKKQKRLKLKEHLYQLVYTLYKIKQQGIMHGDIKPDNIFFDKVSSEIKIGDWGLCQFDRTSNFSANKEGGIQTLSYRAPEVGFKKGYTYKADIWSLGLLILELALKKRITSQCEDYTEVAKKMGNLLCCNIKKELEASEINKTAFLAFQKKYKDIGKELVKLVFKMLLPNPKIRIDYDEILTSPYFSDYKFKEYKRKLYFTPCLDYKDDSLQNICIKLKLRNNIYYNSLCMIGELSLTEDIDMLTRLCCILLSCKMMSRRIRDTDDFREELEKVNMNFKQEELIIKEKDIVKKLSSLIYNHKNVMDYD